MEMTIPQKLQMYIKAEMQASIIYQELAKMAPNKNDRRILMGLSNDERSHANEFKRVYQMMTGRSFEPVVEPVTLTEPYEDILKERVIDESEDYRTYADGYIESDRNIPLKRAFFHAMTDENVHALRLLYLIS